MILNFNLKIKCGKNTDLDVAIISTAINQKQAHFKNSERNISDRQLANALEKLIKDRLQKWALGH